GGARAGPAGGGGASWFGMAGAPASRRSARLGSWGRFALARVPVRVPRPPRPMASGRSRQLVRGGSVLPLGGPPASQRGGVGNGRQLRSRHGTQAALPVGRRAADPGASQSRLPRGRDDRCSRVTGRRQRARLSTDDRQLVGVGGGYLPAVSGLRLRSLP